MSAVSTDAAHTPDAAEPDRRPGAIHVTVVPWGDVWIDGRYMGRAPTQVTLPPGRHVIAGGAERPTVRRVVRLGPAQTRRVELDLGL